jgi:hypothetical protein
MVKPSPTHARGIARSFMRDLDKVPSQTRFEAWQIIHHCCEAKMNSAVVRSIFISESERLRKLPPHPADVGRIVARGRTVKESRIRNALLVPFDIKMRRDKPGEGQDPEFKDSVVVVIVGDLRIKGKTFAADTWTAPALMPLHAIARSVERGGAEPDELGTVVAEALNNAVVAVEAAEGAMKHGDEFLLPAPEGAWICTLTTTPRNLCSGWIVSGNGGYEAADEALSIPCARINTYYPDAWLDENAKNAVRDFALATNGKARDWGFNIQKRENGLMDEKLVAATKACVRNAPKASAKRAE